MHAYMYLYIPDLNSFFFSHRENREVTLSVFFAIMENRSSQNIDNKISHKCGLVLKLISIPMT